jgi:hypothetical protein
LFFPEIKILKTWRTRKSGFPVLGLGVSPHSARDIGCGDARLGYWIQLLWGTLSPDIRIVDRRPRETLTLQVSIDSQRKETSHSPKLPCFQVPSVQQLTNITAHIEPI